MLHLYICCVYCSSAEYLGLAWVGGIRRVLERVYFPVMAGADSDDGKTMMMIVMMTVMACNTTVTMTVTLTVIADADNHIIFMLAEQSKSPNRRSVDYDLD